MRTEELASSAMAMDKVDLCGRSINVGRPKGYVEPPQVGLSVIRVNQPPQENALWRLCSHLGSVRCPRDTLAIALARAELAAGVFKWTLVSAY